MGLRDLGFEGLGILEFRVFGLGVSGLWAFAVERARGLGV